MRRVRKCFSFRMTIFSGQKFDVLPLAFCRLPWIKTCLKSWLHIYFFVEFCCSFSYLQTKPIKISNSMSCYILYFILSALSHGFESIFVKDVFDLENIFSTKSRGSQFRVELPKWQIKASQYKKNKLETLVLIFNWKLEIFLKRVYNTNNRSKLNFTFGHNT